MRKTKLQQPKTVVEKIRHFRTQFTNHYLKMHKKFDIYEFTAEFLKGALVKKA